MKWALSLLCCLNFSLCLSHAGAAELNGGRVVYLMPMGHGLDQFLADRLTRLHVLQVVTDPSKADTVITDRVGATLQSRLKDLYPPPPRSGSQGSSQRGCQEAMPEKPKSGDAPPSTSGALSAFGDASNKVEQAGNMASSGSGRGTIFLVDVKSSQVIWSIFERPKNNSPRALDQTAERIVKRLKEDLAAK